MRCKGDINFLIIILLALTNVLFWIKNEGIFYSLFIILSLLITNKLSVKKKLYLIIGCFILVLFRIIIFNYYNIELHKEYFQFGETFNFELISARAFDAENDINWVGFTSYWVDSSRMMNDGNYIYLY